MRRWLALLLLALLPLQFSWAAVAGYCGHEVAAGTGLHLGHHVHQHASSQADSADKTAGAKPLTASVDLDCGPCHGLSLGLQASWPALTAPRVGQAPAEALSPALRLVTPPPPERPQWAHPA